MEEATWRMQRGGCGVARDLGAFIVHELDEAIIFQFARVKIPVEKAERERERERGRERARARASEREREVSEGGRERGREGGREGGRQAGRARKRDVVDKGEGGE